MKVLRCSSLLQSNDHTEAAVQPVLFASVRVASELHEKHALHYVFTQMIIVYVAFVIFFMPVAPYRCNPTWLPVQFDECV
jgi:hypothetical protein